MSEKSITIYGAFDDQIEIEGAIVDEFSPDDDEVTIIATSDGTVLSIEYAKDGIWRIHRKAEGTAKMTKTEATDPDRDYSDRVTLTGDIKWLVAGNFFEKTKP